MAEPAREQELIFNYLAALQERLNAQNNFERLAEKVQKAAEGLRNWRPPGRQGAQTMGPDFSLPTVQEIVDAKISWKDTLAKEDAEWDEVPDLWKKVLKKSAHQQ